MPNDRGGVRPDGWTITSLAIATAATAIGVSFGQRFLVYVPSFESEVPRSETFTDIEAAWVGSMVFLAGGIIPFTVVVLLLWRRQPVTFAARAGVAASGHLLAAVPSIVFIAASSGFAVAFGITTALVVVGSLLYLAVLTWRYRVGRESP